MLTVPGQQWSCWTRVISGVPQGSVLGPILFLIYINDPNLGTENDILKFADDTKLYGIVTNNLQADSMQRDLCSLNDWTTQWQMKFIVDKCTVMYICISNEQHEYMMNGQVLQQVEAQSDLGVIIRKDLNAFDQCAKAYAKASRVIGMIDRIIRYKSVDIMLRFYKNMVGPHMKYCTAAWLPTLCEGQINHREGSALVY